MKETRLLSDSMRLQDHCSRHGKDGEFQFQYAYWWDHEKQKEWTRLCDHFNPQGWLACSDKSFDVNAIEQAIQLFNECQTYFSSNRHSRRFRVVDKNGCVVIPDEWNYAALKNGTPCSASSENA